MARILIVERAGRAESAAAAIRERGHAVSFVEGEPLLPGTVFNELPGVTILAWLMGEGEGLHAEVNGEQLETILTKIVDTGVRAVIFVRPAGEPPNEHVEHARATWHIPVTEVDTDPDGGEAWAVVIAAATDELLGL